MAGSAATAAESISLADAGFKEREHLQEWVLTHPEIIGPDVMIVTFEFDKWSSAGGEQKDRLDVLGLGKDGRIVVAELKRGRAPDTTDMQALILGTSGPAVQTAECCGFTATAARTP